MNEFAEEQPDPRRIPRLTPEWRRQEHEFAGTPDTGAPFLDTMCRPLGEEPDAAGGIKTHTALSLSTERTTRPADKPKTKAKSRIRMDAATATEQKTKHICPK